MSLQCEVKEESIKYKEESESDMYRHNIHNNKWDHTKLNMHIYMCISKKKMLSFMFTKIKFCLIFL